MHKCEKYRLHVLVNVVSGIREIKLSNSETHWLNLFDLMANFLSLLQLDTKCILLEQSS